MNVIHLKDPLLFRRNGVYGLQWQHGRQKYRLYIEDALWEKLKTAAVVDIKNLDGLGVLSGAPVLQPLTEKQEKMLALVIAWRAQRGLAPTFRELAGHLGVTTNAVTGMLGALQKKGYIKRGSRQARSMEVLEEPP